MTTAEQDQEQDSRPQLLCESDDIVVIYNSTEKEVFHWFVKTEDSELTDREKIYSYTTSGDGNHRTAALRRSNHRSNGGVGSPSEQ